MKLPYLIIISLLSCVKNIFCNSHCVGTCYSGSLSPEPQEIAHGKHLKGYSYNNITTDDPAKCYQHCVQDCRCKACQMKDARCELLDEDKTSKADNFTAGPGYVYFDLKQTMYQGSSHLMPPGVSCYNGCCRSQPCMNGGTCEEKCQTPKEKFTCTCQNDYKGRTCEERVLVSSCLDVMISSNMRLPKNGVYTLKRSDTGKNIPVYCAFVSPNQAWTLIESFSFGNVNKFKTQAFYQNMAVNNNQPLTWELYRMGSERMKYVRLTSTLFRATCDFPNRTSLTPDLLIGRLSDVDIIDKGMSEGCKRYKFIDIRGHNCTECTALTASDYGMHYHIDVTHKKCDFNPPDITSNADCFGHYGVVDEKFKCTSTPQSTTQWWLGEEK